jgi:predicted XRE-type DNA-binding protein
VTASNKFHKKKFAEFIKENQRITHREVAVKLGISQERVVSFLMFFKVSRFVQDGFLTCRWQR